MGIECEMTAPGYVVCMTGMGDTKEMLSYFASCLLKLDKVAEKWEVSKKTAIMLPEKSMKIIEAKEQDFEWVELKNCENRISAGYVFAYPPGIPIICPGEVISEEIKSILLKYHKEDRGILKNLLENKVKVVK